MSKFIIENRSSLSDIKAFGLVMDLLKQGKGNSDKYPEITKYNVARGIYCVNSRVNPKSERFIVYNVEEI